MKRICYLRLVLALVVPLLAALSANLHAFSAGIIPFDFTAYLITTPRQAADFLEKNFQFKTDTEIFQTEDYWQNPLEFWERREGDCEDFALMAQYLMNHAGIEAYVVSLYGENGYAHTIAVFKDEGGYEVFDLNRVIETRSETLEDAISAFYPQWTWGAVAEQDGIRGRAVRRFENISALQ